jgi:uncharacterized membrane protein
MIKVLENNGYVEEIRSGNTPIYQMKEDFIQLVLNL